MALSNHATHTRSSRDPMATHDDVRTVLISMPWESIARPSLALGMLSAIAAEAGRTTSVLHLNLDLASQVGVATYSAFAENVDLFPLGEHMFAVDIFGGARLDSDTYLRRFGAEDDQGQDLDPLHLLRDVQIPTFLERAAETVLELAPQVVGFTCTFNQVLPSLALARRLKAIRPDLTIVIGGACVHGKMGEGYLAGFPEVVDFVFTGEADDSFSAWLDAFAAGEPDRPIPGVSGRVSHRTAVMTQNLDRLPVPDYSAYFERREALQEAGASLGAVRHLPYESSRGCWWGEKHHCTFCGLNNEGMQFRRKTAPRVVAELEELAASWGMTSFMASDNILDYGGYRDLLHLLSASPVEWDLFYEIKANLKRADVASLRRAGVWRVQPGIESFSDHVLALMRKGTTGLANVQALKWLQEYGIKVDFNILVGFPGETSEDYDEQIAIMSVLTHLPPPNGRTIEVRVDRFSPFYDDPAALGIRDLRAADHYQHLIPTDVLAPERYAYFFDHDQSDLDPFRPQIAQIDEIMADWKRGRFHRRARLGPDMVDIQSWTDGVMSRRTLKGTEARAFVIADGLIKRDALISRLSEHADRAEIETALETLVHEGILVSAHDRMLAVVPYATPHTDDDLRAWLGGSQAPPPTPRAREPPFL